MDSRAADARIISGEATLHEVLGELAGVPPEVFPIVEQDQAIKVLAAKINLYWNSLSEKDKPKYMTMRQFQAIFRNEETSPWKLGNALRVAEWKCSRRRWKESGIGGRCRVWVPPSSEDSEVEFLDKEAVNTDC
jgi:hypothetical protein